MDPDGVTVVINVTERDLPHRTKVIMQALKMDEQGHLKLAPGNWFDDLDPPFRELPLILNGRLAPVNIITIVLSLLVRLPEKQV